MGNRKELLSERDEETLALGISLGEAAIRGTVYALVGDLGTGKTVLARGIARGLGIDEEVTSPTYMLLEIYNGRLPLYHFDLYRVDSPGELDQLFFEEYWEGDGVSVIEWANRAAGRLPDSTITITLQHVSETTRRITIEYPGN